MLATVLRLSTPKVEVALAQSTVVIAPYPHDDEPPPTLRGVATVQLPTGRCAQRLYVTLEGKYQLYADEKYPAEKGRVFLTMVELPLDGEELEAGNHVFAFVLDVPTSATIHQRTQHGKVLYSVVASLQLAQKTTVCSAPEPVVFCGVPFHNDFPPPFEFVHKFVSPGLGPVRVQLFSPHLAISSLVHLQISLASPPTPVHIDSVRLSLSQSFAIDYSNPERPRNPPSTSHSLLNIESSHTPPISSESKSFAARIDAGGTWEGTALFRVPAHGTVCASTAQGTTSKLAVTHRLKVEILYKGGPSGTKSKSAAMEIPAHLGYCEAIPASWSLPQYSFEPPKTRVKRSKERTLCLCEYSHAEAVEMYGEVLKEAREREVFPLGEVEEDQVRRSGKSAMVSVLSSYSG